MEVIGRVRSFNDYPCVGLVPAFSGKAIEALREFFEPNGEILPLVSTVGPYFAYNITTIADVLDLERSDVLWPKGTEKDLLLRIHNGGRVDTFYSATLIRRYEFIAERLSGLSIFRIPEEKSSAYVTERFVARKDFDLQGMNFIKVPALPRGANWRKLNEQKIRRMERKETRGKLVKGNSVVLRLRAGDGAKKPSANELAAVERMMDELDALLINVDVDASEAGSLEGHEWVDADCRLFFSCPDAEALVERLWPWLKSLRWPGKVMLMKRDGNYRDSSAPEEYVDLSGDRPRYKSPVSEERSLNVGEEAELASFIEDGYGIIKIDPHSQAEEVVKAIQKWMEDFRAKKLRLSKKKLQDTALSLGSLWGQMVCSGLVGNGIQAYQSHERQPCDRSSEAGMCGFPNGELSRTAWRLETALQHA